MAYLSPTTRGCCEKDHFFKWAFSLSTEFKPFGFGRNGGMVTGRIEMRYAIRTVIAIAVLAVTTAFSLAEEKEKIPHDDAVGDLS